MKNKIKSTLLIASSSAFFFTACGPTTADAVKYNDGIVNIQKDLIPAQDAFAMQEDGHNLDSLKLTFNVLVDKAKKSMDAIDNIKPFGADSSFMLAARDFFTTINGLVDNEAKQIVEILCKDSASRTADDITNYNKSAERYQAEYSRVLQQAEVSQSAFSAKWKFEITK